jgi:GTPase SAR1 family protein
MLTEATLRQVVETFDLREHIDRLDDRERDASLGLLVMVIGAGNFGKSSLINALCGREVAPVSVIPKTFKIDVFSYGRSGTALVRKVGEARPTEMTVEHARLVESEAERQFSDRDQVRLAEIIWRHENLNLPRGISIVDTPGISQALGKSAKGVSLTTVLGSTFEVDEVWARWFHRADLVLWAFCANKMEDEDTQSALEAALSLFDKQILPIATKADLIPQDRWPEIHERFNKIYGPILGSRQAGQLQLTVCGGKRPEMAGTGVKELRENLQKVADEALAVKQYANDSFLKDASSAVHGLLDQTASTLVGNLRAIAALGDSLAEEAEKEAERGRMEAIRRVNNYLAEVRRDPMLQDVARSVHELTKGGRKGSADEEARNRLSALIDERQIERLVNDSFAESARSLEATAQRLAQGTEISRLSFKSSGRVDKIDVPLRLKLKAFAVTSKLNFDLQLQSPSGFFGNAWDLIKRVFGLDRFTYSDIFVAMSGALLIPESELTEAREQALYEGFAPALLDAFDIALKEHLDASDAEAIRLLAEVDRSLPLLQPGPESEVTTYGSQGLYWSTLAPSSETLLGLARHELAASLEDVRNLMREPFTYESPEGFPAFEEIWRRRKLTPTSFQVEIPLAEVIAQARMSDRPMVEATDDNLFLSHLLESQRLYLEQSDLLNDLDDRLATQVSGVEYRLAGRSLAAIGAREFEAAVHASTRVWADEQGRERLANFDAATGTVFGLIASIIVGTFMLFVQREAGFACFAVAIIWTILGIVRPQLELGMGYRMQIGARVDAEVIADQEDAAERLTLDHVDEAIRSMEVELSPRPLQKLLVSAGLLEL